MDGALTDVDVVSDKIDSLSDLFLRLSGCVVSDEGVLVVIVVVPRHVVVMAVFFLVLEGALQGLEYLGHHVQHP